MIIFDYPSEESYWKHKLSKANYWLNEYPTSKTQKNRIAKYEKRLEDIRKSVRNI